MRNTIALFASARRNGNTGQLIDRIAKELEIDVVDLASKDISAFDYAHRNRGDDFLPLMRNVLEHDNIIFASPVYWYAVSSPMKIFLDRISDFLLVPDLLDQGRRLRGKTGYVVCTSISREVSPTYLNAFKDTFEYLGMRYGGHVHGDCRSGYRPKQHEQDILALVQKIRASSPESAV